MPRWSEGLGRKSFKSISCSGHYCKIFQKIWCKERLFLYRICWNRCAQTQILKVKPCFSTIYHEIIFFLLTLKLFGLIPYSKKLPSIVPRCQPRASEVGLFLLFLTSDYAHTYNTKFPEKEKRGWNSSCLLCGADSSRQMKPPSKASRATDTPTPFRVHSGFFSGDFQWAMLLNLTLMKRSEVGQRQRILRGFYQTVMHRVCGGRDGMTAREGRDVWLRL